MSIDFNGTNEYIFHDAGTTSGDAPGTDWPITFGAIFNPDTATPGDQGTLIGFVKGDVSNRYFHMEVNTDGVVRLRRKNGATKTTDTANTVNATAWNSALGVIRADADATVILNAGTKVRTTDSVDYLDTCGCICVGGRRSSGTNSDEFNGKIAWAGMWALDFPVGTDVGSDAWAGAMLNRGMIPRPDALIHAYWITGESDPVPDYINNGGEDRNLAWVNAPVKGSEQARVMWVPRTPRLIVPSGAPPAADPEDGLVRGKLIRGGLAMGGRMVG